MAGGGQAAQDIKEGITEASNTFVDEFKTVIGNAKIDLEARVGQISVHVSSNGGLNASLDDAKLTDAIRVAVNEVVNTTDNSTRDGSMITAGSVSLANNPTSMA